MKIGDQIPDIQLTTTDESITKFADLGKVNLVVYFYPKDSTPGCTTEGLDFKQNIQAFNQLNTKILGVSRESIKSHNNFKTKQGFPFELISDPDEILCKAFDVIKLKKLYGREYMGIERSSFLFNTNGKLVAEWRKVKVKGHVDAVLEAVKQF
ncbi:MAG: peroxiredoxin [Enterobacterales bacterium]|nr:peroxiredoxin [Enterobacterales bacterium]